MDQSGNGDRSPVLSPSQQAVDASGEVIFLTDRVGVITFVNPQFERLYGYSAQEVVGRTTPRILKSGYTVPATYHAMWQRLRCGESVRCEIINRTKDGRLVHIEGSANPIRDENQNIVGYLAIQRDVTARRAAEEALRESEARYRTLADAAHDHIFIIGHDGRFVYINPRGAALLDMTPQEVVGKRLDECMPPELAATVEKELLEVHQTAAPLYVGHAMHLAQGDTWQSVWLAPMFDDSHRVKSVMGISRDITERRELEAQLHQAQKMEAVGRLAGGIAHDFNNLLTAILGYSDLLADTFAADDRRRDDVDQIRKAGESAATLTRQLLTLSRRQISNLTILDLNTVIAHFERIVRRTIGEDIAVDVRLGPGLDHVKADATQLEQILMNLSVNARDAMPNGGTLTIETANLVVDSREQAVRRSVPPGCYVTLAISDTGVGMSPAVQSHLFEPFFTTKGPGKGTGLGLSTVHGIVKQSNGYIGVASAPHRGTTFTIYLPGVEHGAQEPAAPKAVLYPALTGSETILVAEDHDGLRSFACKTLESCGYRTLAAKDAHDAMRVVDHFAGPIHRLLTDVVMPGKDGLDLSRDVTERRAETRVLYMSGNAGDVVERHGLIAGGLKFLQKPFSQDVLARSVREALQA